MVKPICELGYPWSQVKEMLGDRLPEFNKWMSGQTVVLCEGRKWNYEKSDWEETNCGPHGTVIYRGDVQRFLRGLPIID